MVRLEVQAFKFDAELLRELAKTLRSEPQKAKAVRSALKQALTGSETKTAFDIFGSDLPDETFAGVFEQPRQVGWREVEL
jgi:hypothetical protein